MHETVFKNIFINCRCALGERIQRHKLSLHIRREPRVRRGLNIHCQVERLIGEMRNRLVVLQQNGLQLREYLVVKKSFYEWKLTGIQLAFVNQVNAFFGQLGHQGCVDFFKILLNNPHSVLNRCQQFFCPLALGARRHRNQATHLGHTHPKKLIQVAGEYAQVTDTLYQRHVGVLGFLQHPGIKTEPAELPGVSVGIFEILEQVVYGGWIHFSEPPARTGIQLRCGLQPRSR